MIKLVITDLDGTFLNSEGAFDEERYKACKKMMDDKGVAFSVCTGKQCERVEELFHGDMSQNVWILGDSATRIKYNDHYVYESLLPNQTGQKIIDKLEEIADDHIIIACTPTSAYIKDSTTPEVAQRVKKSYTNVTVLKDLKAIEENFIKITIFDPKLRCYDSVKELVHFEKEAFIVASEAAWIDIANKNVHKGTTVERLQKDLGVTREETMVFGDGFNDRELILAGEYSFAVQNAFKEIKEMANYITKSNNDHGVLRAIEHFIPIQESI